MFVQRRPNEPRANTLLSKRFVTEVPMSMIVYHLVCWETMATRLVKYGFQLGIMKPKPSAATANAIPACQTYCRESAYAHLWPNLAASMMALVAPLIDKASKGEVRNLVKNS